MSPGAVTAADVVYANRLAPAPHTYVHPVVDDDIDDFASDEVAAPVAKYTALLDAHGCGTQVIGEARTLVPKIEAYQRLQAAADRARAAIVGDMDAVRTAETRLARVVRGLPATHPLRVALAAYLVRYDDRHGVTKRAASLRHKKTPPAGPTGTPNAAA